MNGLDLFSGIGGISLALKPWVRTIAYCEIEPYCQSILLQRMQEGYLCKAPIWDDVKTFPIRSSCDPFTIDIIFGGFPCQDISVAGAGKGLAGERSGLFFEIAKLASEIKPRWLFLENVPAITTRGGTEVVRTLTQMGYDCRWCVISAASVGALHRRKRWFLLAHSKHYGTSSSKGRGSIGESITSREQQEQEKCIGKAERTGCLSTDVADSNSLWKLQSERCEQDKWRWTGNGSEDVADTISKGLEGQRNRTSGSSKEESLFTSSSNASNSNSIASQQTDKEAESVSAEWRTWGGSSGLYWPFESREHWQEVVSGIRRTSDGVPCHVERLKSLGNSVVPQQVRKAFKILMGIK